MTRIIRVETCDECCRVWAGVLSPEDEIRAIGI